VTILVVDDEPDMLQLLKRSIEPDLDCQVLTASSGESALAVLSQAPIDLVLADIKMPGMDGLALLEVIKRDFPFLTVVMMTAYGHIEMAVEAMKCGAYDFITKPFDYDALILRLEKALERCKLIKENQRLQNRCQEQDRFQNMVGKSEAMQRVFETIDMVAKTDLTVLITGESGTGKDLTARAVHSLSGRSAGPYIAVNCPTLPVHILESELFGYKKGAFTHAVQNKKGLFQEADQGSIFLDEIGDIGPTIQTKLLRVLQEKEIKPLGDARPVKVDVRIIASTNQDLQAKIKNQTFREDFFYRLNVLPIHLPSLRQRTEDIPLLIVHLLKKHSKQLNRPVKELSPELLEIFMSRTWDGNVREMENILAQGLLFAKGEVIHPQDVGFSRAMLRQQTCSDGVQDLAYKDAKEQTLIHFNHAYIGRLLTDSGGNVSQAAKQCGMERQALQQIMRRYGIKADKYRV